MILLVGGLIIGMLYGKHNGSQVTALLTQAFPLILALFLLEMGLVAAETLRKIQLRHWRVIAFALCTPPLLSLAGLFTGIALGLTPGTTIVLATLTASASYIAAPVAVRHAIEDADIGLVMLASLGITFPFNVLIGIELYASLLALLG